MQIYQPGSKTRGKGGCTVLEPVVVTTINLGFYAGTAEISDNHSQSGITEQSAPTR
ncbi:hypothetical protein SARI_00712 [Salmonella enterica subsp. arizonae serovar 62:z4,z23:-]|uniref:Uncharacterized protein n=1 Tax=Salmonella arizonae (strain ATCC BAA-731 / CDC346-86 / RSK2980) TaxID=41514 RepID=A9MK76_SALAR|nr:hypothetical protein SARI_00712 [Salmonella enterica subsp. arizonae serovar 62:z4,z23:-]